MSETVAPDPRVQVQVEPERPRLYKVIVLNDDDYTPREFVITVLEAEFPDGRGAGSAGDVDGAPTRGLRSRRIHAGRGRDKGDASDLRRRAGRATRCESRRSPEDKPGDPSQRGNPRKRPFPLPATCSTRHDLAMRLEAAPAGFMLVRASG